MAPKNGMAIGKSPCCSPRQWAMRCTTTTRRKSWTRSRGSRRPSPASPTRGSMSWARCSGPATTRRRTARRSCTSAASCAARASSSSPNTWRPTRRPGLASRCCSPPGASSVQYNVGAQTRRTANVVWHEEDRLEIHPHDAEQRGVRDGDWVKLASRAGETTLRAQITDRVAPGVVYTTFHHPDTQANVVTTDFSDWATNCPEYKVTAVQLSPRTARAPGRRDTRSSPPKPPHRATSRRRNRAMRAVVPRRTRGWRRHGLAAASALSRKRRRSPSPITATPTR